MLSKSPPYSSRRAFVEFALEVRIFGLLQRRLFFLQRIVGIDHLSHVGRRDALLDRPFGEEPDDRLVVIADHALVGQDDGLDDSRRPRRECRFPCDRPASRRQSPCRPACPSASALRKSCGRPLPALAGEHPARRSGRGAFSFFVVALGELVPPVLAPCAFGLAVVRRSAFGSRSRLAGVTARACGSRRADMFSGSGSCRRSGRNGSGGCAPQPRPLAIVPSVDIRLPFWVSRGF